MWSSKFHHLQIEYLGFSEILILVNAACINCENSAWANSKMKHLENKTYISHSSINVPTVLHMTVI